MPVDVVIPSGSVNIVLPNADIASYFELLPGYTGEKLNITNMALARGLLIMRDYGDRINSQTDAVTLDIDMLKEMQAMLSEMGDFDLATATDSDIEALLRSLASYGVNYQVDLPVKTQYTTRNPVWQYTYDGLPRTTMGDGSPVPASYLLHTGIYKASDFPAPGVYITADGKYFWVRDTSPDAPIGSRLAVEIKPPNTVSLDTSDFTEAGLARVRRMLERAIEARTQVQQSKQAFIQDLVANHNKWFLFTTGVLERHQREALSIIGHIA